MSKSGLFAHFRSKEDLQLATIDAAAEMFHREVMQPGKAAPPGVSRILSSCEAFFQYVAGGLSWRVLFRRRGGRARRQESPGQGPLT
jgi:AcrR family transcriptional regulator